MPRLGRFRLERRTSSEKIRRHVANVKNKPLLQFQKLFHNADVVLPPPLQHFLSGANKFPDNERNNSNKIRVVLKINECRDTPSCLTVNKSQNCVGVIDPTPSRRSQTSNNNVNLFPFDSILIDSDSPGFLISDALVDPILDFFKGKDSCIFSFGHSGLGKTKSMIGSDQSLTSIGIIPCALAWTFKLIDYMKANTNMRYSVRISAVELSNHNNVCDLLANSNVSKSVSDPKTLGTSAKDTSSASFSNQKELPANNILEAAHILDNALATRSNDNESLTHLQLIIHLYQYRVESVEQGPRGSNMTAITAASPIRGERSRLYLLDLGSGRHGNEDQKNLSLQGISKVILALYTSQRHLPYKENVLTQLLKNTLNTNISTTMLVHISSKEQNYSETLQVVQLAYKLYRMRLKKYRSVGFSVPDGTSSCSSSSSGIQSRRLRPHMGIGAAIRSSGNSSASSEFELTSASELSCCETVIFKGNANQNLSDKSPDRLSGKRKLRSVSSDSDNTFSDRDTSKSLAFLSGSNLSPTVIRRRRTSPRTNARAWPTTTESLSNNLECSPELWVDGPNAVYKGDLEKEKSNNYTRKPMVEEPVIELSTEDVSKPVMISKETQCDDVWDSGSSMTDGSSHSNTLDRKDHRPLSDISECTEETESNLAVDSEIAKMNMIDQLEQTNVLDDLLESTFGLTPLHHENQFKPLEQTFLGSQNLTNAHQQFMEKIKKPSEMKTTENLNEICGNSDDNFTIVEPVVEKKVINRRDSIHSKKHYHSASDSKRSSKSENKEIRRKSKCKKCSRKGSDNRSKSMTSSSSTDFSRVASWIENVEYEIQSSKTNKSANNYDQYDINVRNRQRHHHHSQPDISYQQDFINTNRSHYNAIQYQHPYSPSIPWMCNDPHQAQYSLYDGYQMTINNSAVIPQFSVSCSNTSFLPITPAVAQIPPNQHMVTQHDPIHTGQGIHSPKSRKVYTHISNISLPNKTVSVTQLPLPPLPKSTVFVDTHVPLIDKLNTPCSYKTSPSANPIPVPVPVNPKCKTLPRDIYSSSPIILKRNKSDLHPKAADTRFGLNDLKTKDKNKKESKTLMSKLLAPFINLRKKINKNKNGESSLVETDIEKSLERRSEASNTLQHSSWQTMEAKLESSLVLSSPYSLVTPPKTGILPTESSSHGSDSSSLQNREIIKSKPGESSRRHKTRSGSITHNSKNLPRQRPTSSGYGSIIIKGDSEVSSHNDSSSEYSLSGFNVGKASRSHGRLKHSISLSNYKLISDSNCLNLPKPESSDVSNLSGMINRDLNFGENVKMAEDLIIQEKLKIALNEERKVVIQLVEVNRMRGVASDVSVMNLMCFKCLDNFEINSPASRMECRNHIQNLENEIENLRQTLLKAQSNLLLITSFDSNPQS